MRPGSWKPILAALILFLLPAVLPAQEQPPPKILGGFETQGSVTAGYRFTDFQGREQKFLELFDLQKGFRLMDFNLMGRAKEGVSPFADSYSLFVSGLGGDPYSGGQLNVRKDKLYDLRINYRQSYFFWDRNDDAIMPSVVGGTQLGALRNLTTYHDLATTRRFGSANLTVHASNSLRFLFEYSRTSRDGVNFTTRTLDYPGAPSYWAAFLRANPYYVEAPINDLANRMTGGFSYSTKDWNLHYRLGYQTFESFMDWQNVNSPQRSIYVDTSRTANERVNSASWSEFRRLKTPVSEFSFSGQPSKRLDLRGSYIYYRYSGPSAVDAAFAGNVLISGTNFQPYSVSFDSRAHLTEPNYVLDQGFSYEIKPWWNLHADYRYTHFTVDSQVDFRSASSPTSLFEGEEEIQWKMGTHQLDVNMEFIPTRKLIFRPGIRYLTREVEVREDGVLDDVRSKNMKSVWPTVSVYFQPTQKFSIRSDFQSNTTARPYTRISAHTDVGGRFVFRYRPTAKLSIEDNLVIRNRKFQETDFQNNFRSNAFLVSYDLNDRFAVFGGMSYDSFLATAFVAFIRGTPPPGQTCTLANPCEVSWRDQTINRVWQAGLSFKPQRRLGFNLSGNFVRSTGAGEISGEPPYFGPLTWPYATGTVYYDVPKLGRFSVDLQRTYYLEEIVRANDFQANLLTLRWTRDF